MVVAKWGGPGSTSVTRAALGKAPAQPGRPQLHLLAGKVQLPAAPAAVDYGQGSYPMYANDQLGNCVEAGIGHQVGQISRISAGAEALFTDSQIIAAYSAMTGYKPGQPSTDQGTYTQDAMAWWRKTGLDGHAIVLYASLKLTDVPTLKQAVYAFGGI